MRRLVYGAAACLTLAACAAGVILFASG